MKYIDISVRTALIVHGYDQDNNEIQKKINEPDYMRKLVAVERIQSVSEHYLLVTASHGRLMYWEYQNTLEELKAKLVNVGISVA